MLERAVVLEKITIGWAAVAGAAAFIIGGLIRSVSLTAFGLDASVEAACAVILLYRLRSEIHGSHYSADDERRAARLVGGLLLFAAFYISADAVWNLTLRNRPEVSLVGIILTIATIPVMVPLAGQKMGIAHAIKSRALRADAVGNAVCWYLAVIVLCSLVAQALFHIWWLDGAASLVVVGLLVVEGTLAWKGADLT
jgi:divalent metal cation (Fe/Co/Zn/Cd) transporter